MDILPDSGTALEVGSGTGQHVAYFSKAFPQLTWQPTELKKNLSSIAAWTRDAGTNNVLPARILDLTKNIWPDDKFNVIICINTIHILAWPEVEALFRGAGRILKPGGVIYVYGPYRYRNKPLEQSNEDFDVWLKTRNQQSGIRVFEEVNNLALENGLLLKGDRAMPANNRSLWWQKVSD